MLSTDEQYVWRLFTSTQNVSFSNFIWQLAYFYQVQMNTGQITVLLATQVVQQFPLVKK